MNDKVLYKLSLVVLLSFTLLSCATRAQSIEASTSSQTELSMQNKSINELPIPELAASKVFQYGMPQRFRTDNGISVWYVHNPMVPMMTVRATFPVGGAHDGEGKAGLAHFCMSMLKEGANGMNAQELSDAIEEIGASLYTSAAQDNSAMELQVMTEYFAEGLKLYADIWEHADFRVDAYERLAKIRATNLTRRGENPEVVSKVAGNRDFFGENSPYALPADGLISSLPHISLDDIKAIYRRILFNKDVVITSAGNIEGEEFMLMLNQAIGHIELNEITEAIDFSPDKTRALSFNIVDKPGAAQSVIRIILPAPRSDAPQSIDLRFLNIPFGGSFTGRLMQNIREDKGYSYGAYSVVAALKHDGLFVATASVASEVTGAALSEFLYELERLKQGDFSQDELDRAKATWQAELVQNFETQSGIVSMFSSLQSNRQEPELFNDYTAKFLKLELNEFNTWARELTKLENASITIVGDKNSILEQTKDLPLPAPVFRNTEGDVL
ncbi:MAG: pitrilysin family protein [Bradymonadales bacterium]